MTSTVDQPAQTDDEEVLNWQPNASDAALESGKDMTLPKMARRLPQLIGTALRLGWRVDPRALAVLLACRTAEAMAGAFGLLATTGMITSLVTGTGTVAERLTAATPSVVVLACMVGGSALLGIVAEWLSDRIGPKVARQAELELIEAAVGVELTAYDDPDFQRGWDAADRGATSTRDLLSQAQSLLAHAASIVAVGLVLAHVHPVLLPLLVLAVLPQAFARVASATAVYVAIVSTFREARVIMTLRWYLCDQKVALQVRSNTIAPYLISTYRAAAERVTQATDRASAKGARLRLYGAFAAGAGSAFVWTALAALFGTGRISLGAAGTAVIALRSASGALRESAAYAAAVYRTGLYVADWRWFLDSARSQPLDRGGEQPPVPELIEARDVVYTYPGQQEPALRGVNFRVRRGEIVAVIGVNGAAKSTLMKLLSGLLVPDQGTVQWGGLDTRTLDPQKLWKMTSLVPQNFVHWPLTARQNITLGQPIVGAGDQEVLAAAVAASADEVIGQLRSGLGTLLTKDFWGGQELSEGQWQRIVVAAAFYRPGHLLILDEPTSALDPRAEHKIFASLADIAKDRATVLVTHNLENTRVAHRIVVLDRGKVIQEGTFEELSNQPGMFRDLRALQSDRASAVPRPREQHQPDPR